jgi:protein-ribulosamine 3-kinase
MIYLIDKYAPFPEGKRPPVVSEADMACLSPERDHTT